WFLFDSQISRTASKSCRFWIVRHGLDVNCPLFPGSCSTARSAAPPVNRAVSGLSVTDWMLIALCFLVLVRQPDQPHRQ
ncbi:MAG: hypothetical protein NC930_02090, partial [Candidatus Omnitrophica bacterium]|nr:hypothetical protein [Candidatus Omnitrophota bacterium]